MKRWTALMMVMVLITLGATACAHADGAPVDLYTDVTFSKADLNDAWDEQTAVHITMDGANAVISGAGATVENGVVTISQPGDYVLSGMLSGRVVVNIDESKKAHLILNSVDIVSTGAPALHIISADKVTLTLAKSTVNTLTDSADYVLTDGEDEPNACLFSKEDLSVNGEGALTVNGNFRHGVNCKDDLRIAGGNLYVVSVEDGIRGRDSIAVSGGVVTVESGEDGLHSSNDEDEGKGLIAVSGGGVTITAGNDGMQAAQRLQVTGGSVTVKTGAGAGEVSSDDYTASRGGWDVWGNWDMSGSEDSVSMKGLKSDGDLILAGGTISVDSEDDAIHATENITVTDGALGLRSGDDGIHSDALLSIADGSVHIEKSYEGIEGACITVSGGIISIVASDDGVNAAGDAASDLTKTIQTPEAATPPEMPTGETPPEMPTGEMPPEMPTGRGGKMPGGNRGFGGRGGMMMDANESNILRITGGSLYVNASGDGLDANGYIYIEGGTVVVDGPSNSGNGALDPGYGAVVTGGVLIAAGASGMETLPDQSSTQPVIYSQIDLNIGDTFAVADQNGALICAFTSVKRHTSVIVSTPALTLGESYSLLSGGDVSGESDNGLFTTGVYSGGETLATVTLSDIITSSGGGGNSWNNRRRW